MRDGIGKNRFKKQHTQSHREAPAQAHDAGNRAAAAGWGAGHDERRIRCFAEALREPKQAERDDNEDQRACCVKCQKGSKRQYAKQHAADADALRRIFCGKAARIWPDKLPERRQHHDHSGNVRIQSAELLKVKREEEENAANGCQTEREGQHAITQGLVAEEFQVKERVVDFAFTSNECYRQRN